jgi:hypothetical protein
MQFCSLESAALKFFSFSPVLDGEFAEDPQHTMALLRGMNMKERETK